MSDPIVTVEEGQLRGKISTDFKGGKFYSFLGIPYAKPPVGDLRFKAPEPAEQWEGIRDATKEGSECPSLHMFFEFFIGSEEDCLNLNIHTKDAPNESKKLKPVMVWIHGGAFMYGSNKSEFFGPDYIMTEDVVFVVINYRLGILGFLSLEDPSLGVPGNAAMKDMVLALKWIQKNIKNFGGDPSNVTIFGESAGAAAVHFLLISPLAAGLFHKAIVQSGSTLNSWALGKHNALDAAKNLGYNETDEKEILKKLKKESAKNIVQAQHRTLDYMTASLVRPFSPVVEKESQEPAFLLEHPVDILKAGKFNKVPVIMGYTTREGLLWEVLRKTKPHVKITDDFELEIPFELNLIKGSKESRDVAAKIKKLYYGKEEPSEENIDCLYLMKTDTQFVHGIHRSINYMAEHNNHPLYVYVMSLDSSINYYKKFCFVKYIKVLFFMYFFMTKMNSNSRARSLIHKMSNMIPVKSFEGVCHADDLGYLFPAFYSSKIAPGSMEESYIIRFIKLWTNFAKFGNPTPDSEGDSVLSRANWKEWTSEDHSYLEIGEELSVKFNPDKERMTFWNDIYTQYGGN